VQWLLSTIIPAIFWSRRVFRLGLSELEELVFTAKSCSYVGFSLEADACSVGVWTTKRYSRGYTELFSCRLAFDRTTAEFLHTRDFQHREMLG